MFLAIYLLVKIKRCNTKKKKKRKRGVIQYDELVDQMCKE
jgi:hypothetical protein